MPRRSRWSPHGTHRSDGIGSRTRWQLSPSPEGTRSRPNHLQAMTVPITAGQPSSTVTQIWFVATSALLADSLPATVHLPRDTAPVPALSAWSGRASWSSGWMYGCVGKVWHGSWSMLRSGALASRQPIWRGPSHSLTTATIWPTPSPQTACGSRTTAEWLGRSYLGSGPYFGTMTPVDRWAIPHLPHRHHWPLPSAGGTGVVCPYPHLAGVVYPSPRCPAGMTAATITLCAPEPLSGPARIDLAPAGCGFGAVVTA